MILEIFKMKVSIFSWVDISLRELRATRRTRYAVAAQFKLDCGRLVFDVIKWKVSKLTGL